MKHQTSLALIKFLSDLAKSLGVSRHVYVVGGAVRNFVMDPTGRKYPVKDIDVVIDAVALRGKDSDWFSKEVAKAIPAQTKLQTNVYGVALLHIVGDWMLGDTNLKGEDIEIANARTESYTDGGYKPDTVEQSGIEDDVRRREFTFNCMTGDTLIPTEKGILRIDQIASRDEGDHQDIRLTVAGQDGPSTAVGWQYSGFAPTLRVTTKWGHSFSCTRHHPVLVLRGHDHEWVQADQLEEGDLLCVPVRQVTRRTHLVLDLPDPVQPKRGRIKDACKPEKMTPELAFVIGCIVAEGSNTHKRVSFSNSDPAFISRYVECFHATFGFQPSRNKVVEKGSVRVLRGVKFVASADGYDIYANSKAVVGWLDDLGLYCGGGKDGKSASHHKVVPWSILQADERSQWAFLAAYLEGDGSIRPVSGRIAFCSASPHVRQQLQVLLGAHGILSKAKDRFVYINAVDSALLWEKIQPWMVTKRFDYIQRDNKARNRYGIPADYIRGFLAGRKQDTGSRAVYATDGGGFQTLSDVHEPVRKVQRLLHDAHARGDFDGFMASLKAISPDEFTKLQRLFDLGYQYVEVTSVDDAGQQDVFDISMGEGVEPAFVANGVVVHNTLLWRLQDLASGPDKAEIIDLSGCGLRDLQEGVMKCPSSPDKTFTDDATRMVRAIKFIVKYGFKLSPDTEAAIRRHKGKIKNIKPGHLSEMLVALLREPTGKKALEEMQRLGLLDVIKDVAQTNEPFRNALFNVANEARSDTLFAMMDMGMPVGKRLGFLDHHQIERLREIAVGLSFDATDLFIQTLKQPGKALDMRALMQEFQLQGKAVAQVAELARRHLLSDPALATDKRRLTQRVRDDLQGGKTAGSYTEFLRMQADKGKDKEAGSLPVYTALMYLSRTAHRGVHAECDRVQDTIQALKDGDARAARFCARTLAKHPGLRGFKGAVVPCPRSSSKNPPLTAFAEALVRHGVGSRVTVAVVRESPVESSRLRRRKGLPGVDSGVHQKSMGLSKDALDPNEPVVIVDDIFTTGGTIRAVAGTLRRGGHKGRIIGATAGYYEADASKASQCPINYAKKAKKFELEVGDPLFTGKYLNSPARIEGFKDGPKGDPMVVVRKRPKKDEGGQGAKKEVKLFKVRYDKDQARRDKEKKTATAGSFDEAGGGKLIGYKVMGYDPDTREVISGANKRIRLRLSRGAEHRMPGKGIFPGARRDYVLDYYGVFEFNAVIIYAFDPADVTSGSLTDREPEITVSKAKVVKFEVLDEEHAPVRLAAAADRVADRFMRAAMHRVVLDTGHSDIEKNVPTDSLPFLFTQDFADAVAASGETETVVPMSLLAARAKPGSRGQKSIKQGRFVVWYLPRYSDQVPIVLDGLKKAEAAYAQARYSLPTGIPILMAARAFGSVRSIYSSANGGFIQLVPSAFDTKAEFGTFIHELAHYTHNHQVPGGFRNPIISRQFSQAGRAEAENPSGTEDAMAMAQASLDKVGKLWGNVAKLFRKGQRFTINFRPFVGPKRPREVVVVNKKGRGRSTKIVMSFVEPTPDEKQGGILGTTHGIVAMGRLMVDPGQVSPKLAEGVPSLIQWEKESYEAYNEAVAAQAGKTPEARYADPKAKWFPTTYSETDSLEWFAELVTARVLAPNSMDPEVRTWVDAMMRTGKAPKTAAKFQKKREVPKSKGEGTTTVYEYSEGQIQHRNREKAKKVEKLRGSLDKLRAAVTKDLKSGNEKKRLSALAVGLMNDTYERVGNEGSADDGHFGVTGWQAKHVSFSGSKATISYVGKSGVKQSKTTSDAGLVAGLKAALKGKSGTDPVFEGVEAGDVNDYLKPHGITAKDIRGLHANREVQTKLKAIRGKGGKLPTDDKKRKEKLKAEFEQAVDEAAKAVGHEPATLRSQYLVPGIEDNFLRDGTVKENLAKQGSWDGLVVPHPLYVDCHLCHAQVGEDCNWGVGPGEYHDRRVQRAQNPRVLRDIQVQHGLAHGRKCVPMTGVPELCGQCGAAISRLTAIPGKVRGKFRGGKKGAAPTIEITAKDLATVLWGAGSFPEINAGHYPGTNFPLRKVPPNALLTISDGRFRHMIYDQFDGWIAERFSIFEPIPRLGERDFKLVSRYVQRRVRTAIIHINNATDGNPEDDPELRGVAGLVSSLTLYEQAIMEDIEARGAAIDKVPGGFTLRGHRVLPDAVTELLGAGYLEWEGDQMVVPSGKYEAKKQLYKAAARMRPVQAGGLKVFLDDERETPAGWKRVYWPDEAIRLLQTNRVSEISLDHDLGDDQRGTGNDVVLWIEEAVATKGFSPPIIHVHSANSSAARKMEQGIQQIHRLHKQSDKLATRWFVEGTKSPVEKEDDEAERLIRRNPKKKPPRRDLRRNRMEERDPDTEKPGADNDRDLSKNYKKLAVGNVSERWVRHLMGAGEPRKPGEHWKTDKGIWVGMKEGPDGQNVTHTFGDGEDAETQAEAFATGKAEKGKDSEEVVQEQKKKEKAEKLKEERDQFQGEIAKTLESLSLPDDVAETLAEQAKSPEMFRAYKVEMSELREHVGDYGISVEMMESAAKDPFKDLDTSDPVAVAEALVQAKAQELLLDPSNIGGKALSSEPMDSEARAARSEQAMKQYRRATSKQRVKAAEKAAAQLTSLDPKSPEAAELDAIIDGIHAAFVLNDEPFDISKSGAAQDTQEEDELDELRDELDAEEDAEKKKELKAEVKLLEKRIKRQRKKVNSGDLLRDPLSGGMKVLLKQMVKQGNTKMLFLDDPTQLYQAEGRSVVRDAMGKLDDKGLGEVSKGMPWEPLAEALNGDAKIADDVKEYLRSMLRDMGINSMTTVQGIAAAVTKGKADAANDTEVYDQTTKRFQDAAAEDLKPTMDDFMSKCMAAGETAAACMIDGSETLQREQIESAVRVMDDMDGQPDPQSVPVAVARNIANGGSLSLLDDDTPIRPALSFEDRKREWLENVEDEDDRKRIEKMTPQEFAAMEKAVLADEGSTPPW